MRLARLFSAGSPLLVAVALSFCAISTGCASPLRPGVTALARGDLPTALHELRSLEGEVGALPWDDQARYALYRGLAELAAGYVPAAHRWLGRARVDADALTPAERGRLEAAWSTLGLMPGEAGPRG